MRCQLFLLLVVAFSCHAQTPKTTGSKNQNNVSNDANMQMYSLAFQSPELVQGIGPSPLLAVPFQCTGDGTVFVDTLSPETGMVPTVFSVLDGKVVKFPLVAMSDLSNVQMIEYFPGPAMVDFLVRASKKQLPGGPDAVGAEAEKPATATHFFIAEFDREGDYKRSIQLDIEYLLSRFAVLPSGEFLLSGYDSATDSVRLAILDHTGQIIRYIDQPLSAEERTERRDADPYKRMLGGEQSAGMTNFVSYKDSVLAWRSGTRDPILEISAGGMSREVPIALPRGSLLADVLPSDNQWVIHVQSASLPESGPHDLTTYAYYEVSPLDGSLLRKLTIPNPAVGSLACKTRGNFIAFSTDKDRRLVESVASDR